jgi:hypothetical protein
MQFLTGSMISVAAFVWMKKHPGKLTSGCFILSR